jgi:ABC-2 type transport system ATP-binding protein
MTHTPKAPPLEAERLTRDFGQIRAVDDLSFHIERGEIVGLLGPNGAGKTTALRMLTGSLVPTMGRVRLAGYDVLQEGPTARSHLGYLPEQLGLYGEMTVPGYLRFVAQVKGLIGDDARSALDSARKRLGLDEVWQRPTRALSRGFRQRVGLAQALIGEPDVLILDEPTSGLDPNQAREFRKLMRSLGSSHAILLSTHILPEAIEVCDRVIILNRGRIVAMDRPDHLMGERTGRGNMTARVRMRSRPEFGNLAVDGKSVSVRVESVEEGSLWRIQGAWDEREADAVLRSILSQGGVLVEWRSGSGGLEEVFRRLTLGEGEEAA